MIVLHTITLRDTTWYKQTNSAPNQRDTSRNGTHQYFSKFPCISHQPISGAYFGWRLINRVKRSILPRLKKSVVLNVDFWGGGAAARQPPSWFAPANVIHSIGIYITYEYNLARNLWEPFMEPCGSTALIVLKWEEKKQTLFHGSFNMAVSSPFYSSRRCGEWQ
jgi:hypothetical protein